MDKLLEMILLQADLLELKANPNRRAKGNVIESGVEPGGPTATVLVRKGTLRVGDVIICGEFYGTVRALINEEGKRLKEAGPSVAVKVLGLNGVPEAGLEFSVVEDEKAARALAEQRAMEAQSAGPGSPRQGHAGKSFCHARRRRRARCSRSSSRPTRKARSKRLSRRSRKSNRTRSRSKSFTAPSARSRNPTWRWPPLRARSFSVFTRAWTDGVAEKAKHEGVQIKLYAIIYELIDQVKEAMAGLLDPMLKEVDRRLGRSAARFSNCPRACRWPVAWSPADASSRGKVRVRRRKDVIYEGVTQSLRRFQDEVNEVRAGMECGIRIEGFSEFQVGDTIECYTMEKIAAKKL